MFDFNLEQLDTAIKAYNDAADVADTITTDLAAAKQASLVGLKGDAGHRVEQKYTKLVDGVSPGGEHMRSAATTLQALKGHLEILENRANNLVASIQHIEQNMATMERQKEIGCDSFEHETLVNDQLKRDKLNIKTHHQELEIIKTEKESYCKTAAKNLDEAAKWAKEADKADKNLLEHAWEFTKGAGSVVIDLLEFAEDHTIQFFYDRKGWQRNWKGTGDGLLHIGELSLRTTPWGAAALSNVEYFFNNDDDLSYLEFQMKYHTETAEMQFETVKAMLPIDEYEQHGAGRAAGVAAGEFIPLAKLSKLRHVNKLKNLKHFDELSNLDILRYINKSKKYGLNRLNDPDTVRRYDDFLDDPNLPSSERQRLLKNVDQLHDLFEPIPDLDLDPSALAKSRMAGLRDLEIVDATNLGHKDPMEIVWSQRGTHRAVEIAKQGSPEAILELIPPDASVRKLTPVPGKVIEGYEYKWKSTDPDGKRRGYTVRIHGPDASRAIGENAKDGWTMRVLEGRKSFDALGNLHPPGVMKESSPFYNDSIANDVHIPVEIPDNSDVYLR